MVDYDARIDSLWPSADGSSSSGSGSSSSSGQGASADAGRPLEDFYAECIHDQLAEIIPLTNCAGSSCTECLDMYRRWVRSESLAREYYVSYFGEKEGGKREREKKKKQTSLAEIIYSLTSQSQFCSSSIQICAKSFPKCMSQPQELFNAFPFTDSRYDCCRQSSAIENSSSDGSSVSLTAPAICYRGELRDGISNWVKSCRRLCQVGFFFKKKRIAISVESIYTYIPDNCCA